MFIGQARRSAVKSACISDEMVRAWARAAASSGQSLAAGNVSARYSRIASDSQTWTSPWTSVGTLPVPEIFAMRDLKSSALSEITTSSKAMPATFMAIHGRNDHDE